MEGTTEKDCSPLWSLYQQIVSDMKNSTPMWEEFITKATKLHSALRSALVAIAAFLDSFQKIADAATNARGATKEIGTALTRVCLRHRAIENRMKTFISTLMDTLIAPLTDKAEEWRRVGGAGGGAGPGAGALGREHARECKRARAELRRRAQEAQRQARKARRAPGDAKRRVGVATDAVSIQDLQERRQQLEEMEEKAVKAALVEERSRFCHFVTLLHPVVECEVAMLAEVGHLQEGGEQLVRQTTEPRTLPPASLQVVCDVKGSGGAWSEAGSAPHSPTPSSRLGSRRSSLSSLCSGSDVDAHRGTSSTGGVGSSTPVSNASSAGTLPAPNGESPRRLSQARLASVCSADSGFRSQDALHRQLSLYVDHGSDNQSVSSECTTPAKSCVGDDVGDSLANAASATWPDLKDTAQFERAATAIMAGRPHTISAGYERGHPRAALSPHTFSSEQDTGAIYARPPLPTRCSSLERPTIPNKGAHHDLKTGKPTSLPPHLTKEMPQAVYVNMSELATLAASRAQQHHDHPHQEKVCSESSASESSLESSSGYGSQGAFAAEDHAHAQQIAHGDVLSEVVTLRRERDGDSSVAAARESLSISLGSLEEAVRSLDEVHDSPSYATINKTKPSVPKRRPVSMTASVWSRRGSASSPGKPPPPVRRSSSISRPQRPPYMQGGNVPCESDQLPPPPAFLLQPDSDTQPGHQGARVAETVKQLTEIRHTPASPGLSRRAAPPPRPAPLSTFQQGGGLERMMAYAEQHTFRKNSLNASNTELSPAYGGSPHGSTPSTPGYGESSFSSFGPRVPNDSSSNYGQTGFKLQQEKKYGHSNTIYAQPSQIIAGFNSVALGRHSESLSPLAVRRNAARSQSADRRQAEQSNLIASLSAKLAPPLSPRSPRRPLSTITAADPVKGKGSVGAAVQPAFLDKLSATLQQQQQRLGPPRANTVREIINSSAQPDPRVCHTSLMEQIKRGATLKRNKHCNDRSAPKIR